MNKKDFNEAFLIGLTVGCFVFSCFVVYFFCHYLLGPVYGPVLAIAIIVLYFCYEVLSNLTNEESGKEK